jgi:UBX domain-containing protein 7
LQNSLDNSKGPKDEDPDALTKGKEKAHETEDATATNGSTAPVVDTPFSRIPSSNPHTEPANGPTTTRIQFRTPDGKRVVRRFDLSEPVRRIYEWLKAEPFEGSEGKAFELIFAGKNLIDSLENTIEQTGLKMSTIMVEFIDDE